MTTTLLPHKFGPYGGQFVPETLMPALIELEQAFVDAQKDPAFRREFEGLLASFVGRPTPLTYAKRLSEQLGGAQIYLKREDLAHTGAHKINNALGQALLVKRMGKKRVVAETGAGQHGVASATAAALLGLECVVYMGVVDIARQEPNVFRMKLLGAEVRPVASGTQTLKDAINEAIRDWVAHVREAYYLLGSVVGPHPYPMMVRDFQSVIGREARKQILAKEGRLPDALVACVGGGSNAMGLFHPFYKERVRLIGVEAGGLGMNAGKHAASLCAGSIGSLHGTMSYLLQNDSGNILEAHSVAPGLDYPGVGPEHAFLKETQRAEYVSVTDDEALEAFRLLSETEGIIPALESSHAVAHVIKSASGFTRDQVVIINLSGRGDKDVPSVAARIGVS